MLPIRQKLAVQSGYNTLNARPARGAPPRTEIEIGLMKLSLWNLLTVVLLLGTCCLLGVFGSLLLNPAAAYNPFPPPAAITAIVLPSDTPTLVRLPATWTPTVGALPLLPAQSETPAPVDVQGGLPGLRPSSTVVPTNTPVLLPTATATRVGGNGGIGGGSCSVEFQDPEDEDSKRAGEMFTTRWTLKNTSGERWRRDSVDIRFGSSVGGAQIHTGSGVYDLSYDVDPQGMIDIQVPMIAPASPGTYTSNWMLMNGDKSLCKFYVTIRVR